MSREPVDELIERQRKEPEAVYKERAEIFEDAVNLKTPARTPVALFTCGHFFSKWFKPSVIYFDYGKIKDASLKLIESFPVDFSVMAPAAEGFIFSVAFADAPEIAPTIRFLTGPMHDIVKDKYTRWPGRELPEHLPFQFIGGEYVEPEEYRQLIEGPIDFVNSVVLPRACENLSKPGSALYVKSIARFAFEGSKFTSSLVDINAALAKNYGLPPFPATFAYAPLDFIGDFLRHPTGVMLDIRRHPDLVKQAAEALVEPIVKVGLALKPLGAKYAFIPLHLNEMLPPKLYNEFYWPALKEVILELYKSDIKSFVFFEGDHMPHVDTILELPKGWGIAYFERPKDFIKVYEKLRGHSCVMGGIPVSLLHSGTPKKIDEYVKKLLKATAPNEGLILAPGVAEITPETPDANLKALINAALKYIGENR